MMGNASIDIGLRNIWKCWFLFRKGKKRSAELERFQYTLEKELWELCRDLNTATYKHGAYRKFVVTDTKTREIVVATMRDRVVHRVLYEYLVPIFDAQFVYDVWSCRVGKGLVGAVHRTAYFLKKYPHAHIWRGDIRKFFDHVDHRVLLKLIEKKVKDNVAMMMIREVIDSYTSNSILRACQETRGRGIPIGNLTSQIFANVYLHEFDFFVSHTLKPLGYVRYGDDFVLFGNTKIDVCTWQKMATAFLKRELYLELHPARNTIIQAKSGLKFLGVELFPTGVRLSRRLKKRVRDLATECNAGSYYGLVRKFGSRREREVLYIV